MKIGIFTRSMNYDLHSMAMSAIDLPYKAHRLRGTTADGYIYSLLETDYDIAINIDEDAFVVDNQRLIALLDYCLENEYVNCGLPDGGVLPIRQHNPLVTNPFFNILNLRELRSRFSMGAIAAHSTHRSAFECKAPWHLIRGKYAFDHFEPYVSFFVWLSQEFKVLYLDGETHGDGLSTILKDHEGQPFLVHSWFSRLYGEDDEHTHRIDSLYRSAKPKVPYRKSGAKRQIIKSLDALHRFALKHAP